MVCCQSTRGVEASDACRYTRLAEGGTRQSGDSGAAAEGRAGVTMAIKNVERVDGHLAEQRRACGRRQRAVLNRSRTWTWPWSAGTNSSHRSLRQ